MQVTYSLEKKRQKQSFQNCVLCGKAETAEDKGLEEALGSRGST